jgi:hypothetical protein
MTRIVALMVGMLLLAGCDGDMPVTVGPDQLPSAKVGQRYEVMFTGTRPGATIGPLDALIKKGSLPPGISKVNPPGDGTGAPGLRGTPTAAGSYTFTVELAGFCTMGGCDRGSREYTLVVNP